MTKSPMTADTKPLRVRWLGQVVYDEAWDLQTALFNGAADHLLLCTHPLTFTFGRMGKPEHLLVDPADVGADVRHVNRGGDITFHGPGQLVGYPVMSVAQRRGGGLADTVAYVTAVEQALIDTAAHFGLEAGRVRGRPGAWIDAEGERPRKLAAVGVRVSRGRSMHGFALNVDTDLSWFDHIVPCGLADAGVTSLRNEGVEATMAEVVDVATEKLAFHLAPGRDVERSDVAWRHNSVDPAPFTLNRKVNPEDENAKRVVPASAPSPTSTPVRLSSRLAQAGVGEGLPLKTRKPSWMKVELSTGSEYRRLKSLSRSLDLVTVCEEARCPNIFECWNEGTATFMLLGDRCTRACGFCLVDTRRPEDVDEEEPQRVAAAVAELDLDFAVLTMVARDDLDDGGAAVVAATVEAIRVAAPKAGVEVLISDLKGSAESLATVIEARPDVLNHNVETVPRLQRAVRPSASYARSLTTLARGAMAGLTTKSGLIVGMGERPDEVKATLADLAAVGVDIVTIGQYLRPTASHLPIHRWWEPSEFDDLRRYGLSIGIGHMEADPLTRSSHHAGSAHRSLANANLEQVVS